MATPKTITAYDVEQGKLTVTRRDGIIQFERRYVFVDAVDVPINEMNGGRLVGEMAIGSLPPTVAAALATIDTWTYNQILAQEGMT